jgi:hypothetical protein
VRVRRVLQSFKVRLIQIHNPRCEMNERERPSFKLQQILTSDLDTTKDRRMQPHMKARSSERPRMQSRKKRTLPKIWLIPVVEWTIPRVQGYDYDSGTIEGSSLSFKVQHPHNSQAETMTNPEESPTFENQRIHSFYNLDITTIEAASRSLKIQDSPNLEPEASTIRRVRFSKSDMEITKAKSRSVKFQDMPNLESQASTIRRVRSSKSGVEMTEASSRSVKIQDIPNLEPETSTIRRVRSTVPDDIRISCPCSR